MATLKACLRASKEALAAGRDAEAVEWAKSGLEHDKRSYEALLLLGKACFRIRDYGQADVAYHRATGINPGALPGWQGLVELYQGSGDMQKLADASEKAVSILKQQQQQQAGGGADSLTRLLDYYRRLAGAQLVLGRHVDARRSWTEIADLGAGSETACRDALHALVEVESSAMEAHVDAETKRQVSRRKKGSRQQDGGGSGAVVGPPVDAEAIARCVRMLWAASEQSEALERTLNNALLSTSSASKDPRTARAQDLLIQLLVLRLCTATGAGDEPTALGLKKRLLRECSAAFDERGCAMSSAALETALVLADEDAGDSLFAEAVSESQLGGDRWQVLGRWAELSTAALPEGGRGCALAGVLARHNQNQFSAEDEELLERSLSSYGDCPSGWQLLAECQLARGDATSAAASERSAQSGLDAVTRVRRSMGLSLVCVEMRLRLVQARALLQGRHFGARGAEEAVPAVDTAEELFNSVAEMAREREGEDLRLLLSAALQGAAQVALLRGEWERAELGLREAVLVDSSDGWSLGELGWLAYTQNSDLEAALQHLSAAIEAEPEQFLHHLRMGRMRWAAGGSERAESVKNFLAAGKLNRKSPEAFACLGFYYYSVAGDGRRARRCFDQAVSLDSSNVPYGALWAKLLKEELGPPAALTACEAICDRSPHAFWAWRERGFLEMEAGQWRAGKTSLQRALPGVKGDAATWEALGLAYQRLQMYSSASGAYTRALEIEPERLFALVQKGHTEKAQGKVREALDQYRAAILAHPGHPVALLGLADGLLHRARELIKLGAFPMAADALQEAEAHAQRGVEFLSDKASSWKLLGDIQLTLSRVAVLISDEARPAGLETSEGLAGHAGALRGGRLGAAVRARQAHINTVHVRPSDASAWLALAGSTARVAFLDAQHGTTVAHLDHLLSPLPDSWFKNTPEVSAAIAALRLDSSDVDAWVTLGLLAEELRLQQHALVQALWLDRTHVQAWAALGQFYLRSGHVDLARKALDCCRAIDPDAAKAWSGGAQIFATYSNEEARKEALSSAAHALRLDPLEGGHVRLGTLALQLGSLKSHEIHASLQQGVMLDPDNPALRNLLALSCEALGLHHDALHHTRVAQAALVLAGTATSAPGADDALAINAGRVLCKMGMFSEAVAELAQQATSGTLAIDESALRTYAVGLWARGNPDGALAALASSLSTLKRPHANARLRLQCQVCAVSRGGPIEALAIFHESVGGGEGLEDRQLALTGLGIAALSRDVAEVAQALPTCRHLFQQASPAEAHTLLAWAHDLQGNHGEAVRHLKQALHTHPWSSQLRARVAAAELQRRATGGKLPSIGQQAPATVESAAALSALAGATSLDSDSAALLQLSRQLQRKIHVDPTNLEHRLSWALVSLQLARETSYPAQLCASIARACERALSAAPPRPSPLSWVRLPFLLAASEARLRSRTSPAAAARLAQAADVAALAATGIAPAKLAALPLWQTARCQLAASEGAAAAETASEAASGASAVPILICAAELAMQVEDPAGAVERLWELAEKGARDAGGLWPSALRARQAWRHAQSGDLVLAQLAASDSLSSLPAGVSIPALHLVQGLISFRFAVEQDGAPHAFNAARKSLHRITNDPTTTATPFDGHGTSSAGARNLALCSCAHFLLAQVEALQKEANPLNPKWEANVKLACELWPVTAIPVPAALLLHASLIASGGGVGPSTWPAWNALAWGQRAVHNDPGWEQAWVQKSHCLLRKGRSGSEGSRRRGGQSSAFDDDD